MNPTEKARIDQRKIQMIMSSFDKFGGTSYFEVLGMLEHCKDLAKAHFLRMASQTEGKAKAEVMAEYERLKKAKIKGGK